MRTHTMDRGLGMILVFAAAVAWAAGADTPAATGPAKKPPEEAGPQVAYIRLSGAVLEGEPDFAMFGAAGAHMTLKDWLYRLAQARNDANVKAVALEVDSPRLNWAQAQELSDAVARLGESKPVYAHLISTGLTGYLVASAATEVSMDPIGSWSIVGLGAELAFFRGTLDLLGIEAQIIQVGRYKGAAEPFTDTEPSKDMLETYNRILDDLYDQLCGQIARQRRLTVPHVKHVIDRAPLAADEAKQFKVVDDLVPKADWRQHVVRKVAKPGKPHRWLEDYARKSPMRLDFSNPFTLLSMILKGGPTHEPTDPTVAIICADGMITVGRSGEALLGQRIAGAKTLVACFDNAREDSRIRAVVFRVDSPGGSAVASELICQAVERCAKAKPVIASLAQVAGSGGYYVAVGAPTILADPAGLTGSIGVVSGKLATAGLMQKIGITRYEMARGKHAGLGMSRAWNDDEQAVMHRQARRVYDRFVERVRRSRGKRVRDIDAVTQGRVFTAREAVGNGLVDRIGGLREALVAAQDAAKLKKFHVICLPRPKTFADLISGRAGVTMPPVPGREGLLWQQVIAQDAGAAYLLNLAGLFAREPVLAAVPYHLSIRH